MDTVIGSLLDRLQGLLSRGFLLGGFIPVFFFLVVNAAMAYVLFPVVQDYAAYFIRIIGDHVAVSSLAIVLVTFFGGIAVWSLNAWLRQFLEGRYIGEPLWSEMQKAQFTRLDKIDEEIEEMRTEVFDYRGEFSDKVLQMRLRTARIAGDQLGATRPIPAGLRDRAKKLRQLRSDWRVISFAELQQLHALLEAELRGNSADKMGELDQMQIEFRKLVEYGYDRVEGRYEKLIANKQLRYPYALDNIGPTRMANLSEVHREYGIRHYGLDIEFFWVRLLKMIKNDPDLYPILEQAKNQLDYSVTTTVLIGIATLFWLILSYLFCSTVYPFLMILVVGGSFARIFYSIAVQNYRSFVETVRSALDLHRFDLLKALHIPLPPDSVAEKALWTQIYLWQDDNKITFIHEDPAHDPIKDHAV
jgi:hypothetical protein